MWPTSTSQCIKLHQTVYIIWNTITTSREQPSEPTEPTVFITISHEDAWHSTGCHNTSSKLHSSQVHSIQLWTCRGGSIALKGLPVVVRLYCDPDIKRAEGVTSLQPHHRQGLYVDLLNWLHGCCKCSILIIGALSLYMVLVSYSSAIKWMLRVMNGGVRGGQEIHTSVSTLHGDKMQRLTGYYMK